MEFGRSQDDSEFNKKTDKTGGEFTGPAFRPIRPPEALLFGEDDDDDESEPGKSKKRALNLKSVFSLDDEDAAASKAPGVEAAKADFTEDIEPEAAADNNAETIMLDEPVTDSDLAEGASNAAGEQAHPVDETVPLGDQEVPINELANKRTRTEALSAKLPLGVLRSEGAASATAKTEAVGATPQDEEHAAPESSSSVNTSGSGESVPLSVGSPESPEEPRPPEEEAQAEPETPIASHEAARTAYVGQAAEVAPQVETASERHTHGGLLALIGVEAGFRYLGDRKSRRIARKATAGLQKQLDKNSATQEQLLADFNIAQSRNERISQQRDDFEQRAARAFERQQRQMDEHVKQFEKQRSAVRAEAEAEKQGERTQQQPEPEALRPVLSNVENDEVRQVVLTAPETDKFVEVQARPDVVMEQVAVAAEHDVPVERVYERRQEVKDEPGTPSGGSGVRGAGDYSQGHSAPALPLNPYHHPVSQPQPPIYQEDRVYKQATTVGIGAALVIIVFALIAYLLLH